MKNFKKGFIFVLFVIAIPTMVLSQMMFKTADKNTKDIFLMEELSILLVERDANITVDMVLPADKRPEKNQKLDVKKGDAVLMLNANRVKSLEQFKEIYAQVKAGEQLSLGIQRNQEMFILEFKKMAASDPKTPKKIIIQSFGDKSDPSGEPQMHQEIIRLDDTSGKVKPILELGLIFEEAEGQVTISKVLPPVVKSIDRGKLTEGDIIESINGQKVESVKQFSALYEQLKPGENVTMTCRQNTSSFEWTFVKPEFKKQIIIEDE